MREGFSSHSPSDAHVSQRERLSTQGISVAVAVGCSVSATVGGAVGRDVGPVVGDIVGNAVGDTVGDTVGVAVGIAVGIAVGDTVGVAVGVAVGRADGCVVAWDAGSASHVLQALAQLLFMYPGFCSHSPLDAHDSHCAILSKQPPLFCSLRSLPKDGDEAALSSRRRVPSTALARRSADQCSFIIPIRTKPHQLMNCGR